MGLGRWESMSMVDRYTRSVTYRDSLEFSFGLEADSKT